MTTNYDIVESMAVMRSFIEKLTIVDALSKTENKWLTFVFLISQLEGADLTSLLEWINIIIIIIIIYYIYIALNTMFLSALQINVLLPRLCPASLI